MKARKLFAWLLTVCMILTLMPLAAVPASAADEDVYVNVEDPDDAPMHVEVPEGQEDPDVTISYDDYEYISVYIDASDPLTGFKWAGSGTSRDPYLIGTAEELQMLSNAAQKGDEPVKAYFRLSADIDLSSVCGPEKGNWLPIGSDSHPFAGRFDGAGHTISNLYINGDGNGHALFGTLTGVVNNLTVDGTVSGNNFVAGIAAKNCYLVSNCVFKGTASGRNRDSLDIGGVVGVNGCLVTGCRNEGTVTTGKQIGGVVGRSQRGSVLLCHNYGRVVNSDCGGGVVGYAVTGSTVMYCNNYGSVEEDAPGGVVGVVYGGTVKYCENHSDISGGRQAGGVAGVIMLDGRIANCTNYGNISGGKYIGGITSGGDFDRIEDCVNYGNVSGSYGVAGITGDITGLVSGCVNRGRIVSSEASTGGIAGVCWSYRATIDGCCNTGEIICTGGHADQQRHGRAGGIIGNLQYGNVFSCLNTGTVRGEVMVGGIAGWTYQCTITRCHNLGDVMPYSDDPIEDFGGVNGCGWKANITNCRNDGNVTGGKYTGGLSGELISCLLENSVCFGNKATKPCGYDWEYNNVACTLRNIYKPDGSYTALDFENIWIMTPDGPRPRAVGLKTDNGVVTISSMSDFKHFRDNVNLGMDYMGVTVRLACNLEFSGNSEWTPIGHPERTPGVSGALAFLDDTAFAGTFDGCNHTISGLVVNMTTQQPVLMESGGLLSRLPGCGLFGKVTGTVKNLQVSGSVTGLMNVGGIVGVLHGGSVTDCSFEGSVSGEVTVGGIVGLCDVWENDSSRSASVSHSFFEGSVTATSKGSASASAGGIVGKLSGGSKVMQCAVLGGSVSAPSAAGGVVGNIDDGAVTFCSHLGSVAVSRYNDNTSTGIGAGGVAGFVAEDGKLMQSYHYTGNVNGNSFVGGVAGRVDDGGMVYSCYYLSGTVTVRNATGIDFGIGAAILGSNPSSSAEYLTEAQFGSSSSFKNWGVSANNAIWSMTETRPVLKDLFGTVSFNANGGMGYMPAYTIPAFGGAIPACAFTRDGYEFLGWTTEPGAGGDWYEDCAALGGRQRLSLYAVWAARQSASYVDTTDNGIVKTADCLVLNTGLAKLRDGWYLVDGSLSSSARIEIAGDVNIILRDGSTLTASNGIRVSEGSSLTVWGQEGTFPAVMPTDKIGTGAPEIATMTQGTGSLTAGISDSSEEMVNSAVIGGNYGEATGSIQINGGVVTVTTRTDDCGAPIGGARGQSGGSITINDGFVSAVSRGGGAAIGGGADGNGGVIAIRGGFVSAVGGRYVAVIDGKMNVFMSPAIGAGAPTGVDGNGASNSVGPTLSISNAWVHAETMGSVKGSASGAGVIGTRVIGTSLSAPYSLSWLTTAHMRADSNGYPVAGDRLEEFNDAGNSLDFSPCRRHAFGDSDINRCRFCGTVFGTIDGKGELGNGWYITSTEQWDDLSYSVANGFVTDKKYFSLIGDIVVTTRVGTAEYPFNGHFGSNMNTLTFACEDGSGSNDPFVRGPAADIENVSIVRTGITYTVAGGFETRSGELIANILLPKEPVADILIVAALYDESGVLADVRSIPASPDRASYHTGIKKRDGYTCKVMLVSTDKYVPLCAAWSSEG